MRVREWGSDGHAVRCSIDLCGRPDPLEVARCAARRAERAGVTGLTDTDREVQVTVANADLQAAGGHALGCGELRGGDRVEVRERGDRNDDGVGTRWVDAANRSPIREYRDQRGAGPDVRERHGFITRL